MQLSDLVPLPARGREITDVLLSCVLTKIILFFPCYHNNFDCCTLEMECCLKKTQVLRCFTSIMKSRHVQYVG